MKSGVKVQFCFTVTESSDKVLAGTVDKEKVDTHIHIQLKLFASLAEFSPQNVDAYPVRAGTSVSDIAARLGIPEKKVRLVFVDGVRKDAATTVNGGERVALFPPVGGG